MVKKACSTFVAFFADVSRNGIDSWSANSCMTVRVTAISYRKEFQCKESDLSHCVFHDLFAGQIGLVANKELVNTLGSVAVDLLQPLLDVVE